MTQGEAPQGLEGQTGEDQQRAPRNDGRPSRNDRNDRGGERPERTDRGNSERGGAERSSTDGQRGRNDRPERNAEVQGERTDGRRDRSERGGERRPQRDAQPFAPELDRQAAQQQGLMAEPQNVGDSNAAPVDAIAPDGAAIDGNGQRRERRPRDRYGRSRRDRETREPQANDAQGDTAIAPEVQSNDASDATAPEPQARSYFRQAPATSLAINSAANEGVAEVQAIAPVAEAVLVPTPSATPAPVPAAAPTVVAVAEPAVAPTPVTAGPAIQGMPKVQSFALPVDAMASVASAAGLQWVNSDPDKIAAVRAAIAAEPKPVHVPRERPPVVVVDEGPLVLVETHKDLSKLGLPFQS